MKLKLTSALLTLLLFHITPVPLAAHTTNPAIKTTLNSTVGLVLPIDEAIYCTGAYVSPTLILTAQHCVDLTFVKQYGYVVVKTRQGDLFPAKVVYQNSYSDVALVRGNPSNHYLRITRNRPEYSSYTFTIGHPLTEQWRFSSGHVSSLGNKAEVYGYARPRPYVGTTFSMGPGSSGGACVTADGLVYGVVSFGYTRLSTFAGCTDPLGFVFPEELEKELFDD